MVAGRLQEKNGFYYIVLSYTDSAGKRRQPWIGTGDFKTDNPDTAAAFAAIRDELHRWLHAQSA